MSTKAVRVAIVGSRSCADSKDKFNRIIHRVMNRLDEMYGEGGWGLVHGAARGIDRMSNDLALLHRVAFRKPYPPKIEDYGIPRAFFERNTEIVNDSDVVVAIWADGKPRTGGTIDTVTKAIKKGLPTYCFWQGHWWVGGLPDWNEIGYNDSCATDE